MVTLTVWPILRSKSGANRSIGHLMPPGAMSVTSCAIVWSGENRTTATTAVKTKHFMASSSNRPVVQVRQRMPVAEPLGGHIVSQIAAPYNVRVGQESKNRKFAAPASARARLILFRCEKCSLAWYAGFHGVGDVFGLMQGVGFIARRGAANFHHDQSDRLARRIPQRQCKIVKRRRSIYLRDRRFP